MHGSTNPVGERPTNDKPPILHERQHDVEAPPQTESPPGHDLAALYFGEIECIDQHFLFCLYPYGYRY